jgi:hypothetical protein
MREPGLFDSQELPHLATAAEPPAVDRVQPAPEDASMSAGERDALDALRAAQLEAMTPLQAFDLLRRAKESLG